ncbi:MAG: hypothetical protein JNK05_12220 [Myxococcales bacterium]|nr:hypothetical protein [Myxococcales bacterium]
MSPTSHARSRTARKRASALTRSAVIAIAASSAGCYAQLSAGVYSVHGGIQSGLQTPSSVVPSFGGAVGFAFDGAYIRALAGAGTQSVPVPVRQPTEWAATGPVHLSIEGGAPVRRAVLRAGVGGTMQFGHRFVVNPADGVLEGRPMTVAHVYVPLTADYFFGQLNRGSATIGLSIAPGMFVGTGNRDLSDFFGFGGDVRLTFAVPMPPSFIPQLGSLFEVRLRPDQERELEATYQRLPEILAREQNERDAADRERARREHNQFLRLQCVSDGRPNCDSYTR